MPRRAAPAHPGNAIRQRLERRNFLPADALSRPDCCTCVKKPVAGGCEDPGPVGRGRGARGCETLLVSGNCRHVIPCVTFWGGVRQTTTVQV